MKCNNRFTPVKRTAVDGKNWWIVYDTAENKYSTLLCFCKYRTKKACQQAIANYLATR